MSFALRVEGSRLLYLHTVKAPLCNNRTKGHIGTKRFQGERFYCLCKSLDLESERRFLTQRIQFCADQKKTAKDQEFAA